MSLPAGRRIGGHEIVGLIGAGGMGEVYRAHDARLQRDVAIKIIPASLARVASWWYVSIPSRLFEVAGAN